MVLSCIVRGCNSKSGEQSIKFHRFPMRNQNLLAKWKNAVDMENVKYSATQCVCSKHFLSSDYEMLPGDDTLKLHDHAVPSVNLPSGNKANKSSAADKNKVKAAVKTSVASTSSQKDTKTFPVASECHSVTDNVNISTILSSAGKVKAVDSAVLTPQRRSVRRALKNQTKEMSVGSGETVPVTPQQTISSPQSVMVQQSDGQQVIYVLVNNPLSQSSQASVTSQSLQIPTSVMDASGDVNKQPSHNRANISPQEVNENTSVQQKEKTLLNRIASGRRQLKSAQQLLRRRERRINTLWKTCQSLYENSDAVSFVRVLNPELSRNKNKPIVSEIKPSVLARLGVVTIY